MAHNVRVRKVALFSKKDGHALKGKYSYRVSCKKCGSIGTTTSQGLADLSVVNHHIEVRDKHMHNHPNDYAHKRVVRNKAKKAGKRGNS